VTWSVDTQTCEHVFLTERLRIDEVQIQAGGETVGLKWADREELLARLRQVTTAATLVAKFENMGTSWPVELDQGDVDVLMNVLVAWQEGGGPPAPEGIRSLAAMVWRVRYGR